MIIFGKLRAIMAAAVLCAAPAIALAVPVSASAQTSELHLVRVSASYFNIVNGTGLCLDADSNHWPNQNGDNVQLWSCNSHPEQKWIISGAHIENYDGQCLDADSNQIGVNGDNVQLWSCNNHGEQSWTWQQNTTGQIVNADHQCLDADSNHAGQNGDNVQVWACNNHAEQAWPSS